MSSYPWGSDREGRAGGNSRGGGKDPDGVSLDQLADQGEIVTTGADDSVEETLDVMKRYKVRRLPVIDGTAVVGIVSQADLARQLPERQVGDSPAAVSS